MGEIIFNGLDEVLFYIREGIITSTFIGIGIILVSMLPTILAYAMRRQNRRKVLVYNILSTWPLAFLIIISLAYALFGGGGLVLIIIWIAVIWLISLAMFILGKNKHKKEGA